MIDQTELKSMPQ